MSSRETFNKAVEIVLAHEAGYVDHPADGGGATNYGISSTYNPGVDVASLTRQQAIEIYFEKYWSGNRFELLPERLAIKVFDLAVNMGRNAAVTCLQRALRAAGTTVAIDGVLGPETAGAASLLCELVILAALRSEAAGEYRVKLVRDPTQAPFAAGWIARAYA
jgi:lysozyme family protein